MLDSGVRRNDTAFVMPANAGIQEAITKIVGIGGDADDESRLTKRT